jgi:hypothetical protein
MTCNAGHVITIQGAYAGFNLLFQTNCDIYVTGHSCVTQVPNIVNDCIGKQRCEIKRSLVSSISISSTGPGCNNDGAANFLVVKYDCEIGKILLTCY